MTDERTSDAVDLNEETVADLDATGNPAGGRPQIGNPHSNDENLGCFLTEEATCGYSCDATCVYTCAACH